jgi:hypothetical protein
MALEALDAIRTLIVSRQINNRARPRTRHKGDSRLLKTSDAIARLIVQLWVYLTFGKEVPKLFEKGIHLSKRIASNHDLYGAPKWRWKAIRSSPCQIDNIKGVSVGLP